MRKIIPVARLLAISAVVLSGLTLAGCLSSGGSGNSLNDGAAPGSGAGNGNGNGGGADNGADGSNGDGPPALAPIMESELIQAVWPLHESIDVSINTKLAVTFGQDMDTETINDSTFLLRGDTGPAVIGEISYDGASRTAIFVPDSGLTDKTLYTATLTTAVQTAAGVELTEDLSWKFTTGSTRDEIIPTAQFNVLDGAANVPVNRRITATFSEVIDPTTVTTDSFTLETGGSKVLGAVSYLGSTAVFAPTENLLSNTLYTATLTKDITDLANPANQLAADQSVSFTTDSIPADGPEPVVLGISGNFVILSKAGITTTGTTEITGDIGVSPIDEAAMTGFGQARDATDTFATSSFVTGRIYAADMASPTPVYLTTAIGDMETAFNDAAGRSNPAATELGAGKIGGLTLAPGLYKWGTDVSASSDVIFNGGPNDVWIMQIDQDLLMESGVAVQLDGGANAENIFWQVTGQVTLRTGSTMQGNLLSKTQIVMETGVTFNGRALAQTLVTLDDVTATKP